MCNYLSSSQGRFCRVIAIVVGGAVVLCAVAGVGVGGNKDFVLGEVQVECLRAVVEQLLDTPGACSGKTSSEQWIR
jgi:hypothetical protein